jgi:peptidoglycan/xylan/chitin deacetylase (PgdA/CDA1 family)
MISMGQSNVFVTSSWDDVTRVDLKLCDLLEVYKIKGTFFAVNNWIGKRISQDDLKHISESYEIGAHTLNHVKLTSVPNEVAKREISGSKRLLEEILEKTVESFAYPNGLYNKTHVEMVQNAKYLCARTTKPFYTMMAKNPYELNVTVWAAPHRIRDIQGLFRLFNLSHGLVSNLMRVKKWSEIGKQIFDVLLESGGVFHLFGHAWQVEEIGGWHMLEDLLSHIAFRKNVMYATMTGHAKLYYYKRAKRTKKSNRGKCEEVRRRGSKLGKSHKNGIKSLRKTFAKKLA